MEKPLCDQCPRECRIGRTSGTGFCGEDNRFRLAWAGLHRGEEPPLSGNRGSGALFFTGCTMACPFCQNYQISRKGMGRLVSAEELLSLLFSLQSAGAANINVVTGSHFMASWKPLWEEACRRGLTLPLLWNSSGYESVSALERYGDPVDLWLPDLKTLDTDLAVSLFSRPDYPARAAEALLWMADKRPLAYQGEALVSGVMVRHLVLPGHMDSTRRVFQWFARHLKGKALLSVMTQYTPTGRGGPDSYLTPADEALLLDWLDKSGIEEGFFQDLVTGDQWLPDFSRRDSFPGDLAETLWHWADSCNFS